MGELCADRVLSRLDAPDPAALLTGLAADAAADLGVSLSAPEVRVLRSVDARFKGQSHDLTVDWTPDRRELESRFFSRYARVYGIEQRGEIELVSYRVRVTTPVSPAQPAPAPHPSGPPGLATEPRPSDAPQPLPEAAFL